MTKVFSSAPLHLKIGQSDIVEGFVHPCFLADQSPHSLADMYSELGEFASDLGSFICVKRVAAFTISVPALVVFIISIDLLRIGKTVRRPPFQLVALLLKSIMFSENSYS